VDEGRVTAVARRIEGDRHDLADASGIGLHDDDAIAEIDRLLHVQGPAEEMARDLRVQDAYLGRADTSP
jgi:hypothetical protein